MRRRLLLVLIAAALSACSEDRSGLGPAERAKQGKGMSDEIWKIYSGAESGVGDEAREPGKDAAKASPGPAPAQDAPAAPPAEKR